MVLHINLFDRPTRIRSIAVLALASGFFADATPCFAGVFGVSMDTGPLNGRGTFYVEFQLTDGSGIGDANSRAVVTGFGLTGGTLGGILPPTFGNVTGSLATAL